MVAYNNLRMNKNFGSSMTSLLDIKNAGQFICKDCRISGSTNNLYYFKFNNTDPEESFKNITGNNTDFTETIMGFEPEFTRPLSDFIDDNSIDLFN